MSAVTWILLGLAAGVLAKFLMPGKDPGGIIVTILIGIAGGFLGGYLGTLAGIGSVNDFNLISLALATGGAILLLIGYRVIRR